MSDYRQFISPMRKPQPTPKKLVSDGQAVFGTFDREFESMDLRSCSHPVRPHLPDRFNKLRLTLWEACEIHLEEGILLAAVSDMGLFGMILHVFFDKRTQRVTGWKTILRRSHVAIAPNLLDGSISEANTTGASIRFTNNLGKGHCRVEGSHTAKGHHLEYAFDLQRVSQPSVVSIPFGPNRPLYTQKDLCRVAGSLRIDGEVLQATEQAAAVVDDHKGFYPYRTHYDWLSVMVGGQQCFGLNLTRNQSVDQEAYNENLVWQPGASSALPPVTFARNADDTVWTIRDAYDMVNLTFVVASQYHMALNAGLIRIDYKIAFGSLFGHVRGLDGEYYVLDGLTAIGEDKTIRF